MSKCAQMQHLLSIFSFAAIALLLLALPERCSAQSSYIEGISAIAVSSNGSEVYTWSETYLTPDLAYYYGAYVEGYLSQNGGTVDDGDASEYPYFNDAIWQMSDPVAVGSSYQLLSYHGVWAYWIWDLDGTDYYYNPDGFESSGDVPSGTDFLPGDGAVYVGAELIYVGSTAVDLSATAPSITSLSPSGAAVGSSGTITVAGTNLLDLCTGNTTVSITGSGISLSVSSASPTQVLLSYSLATNASTGSQSLTLTTCFGTSNSATFEVGDPTPVITSVVPNAWPAGQQISFTISGTGFGTAPTLQVVGNGVSCCTSVSASDTQITGTATVASNAPNGVATVTITSTGYYGSGFMPVGGGSSSASTDVSIVATQGPAPTIVWGPDPGNGSNCSGSNIANTANSRIPVVVGQQIAFTGCFSPPQGATILMESWSPPVPYGVVSGYNVTQQEAKATPFASTACVVSGYCDFPTFYWLNAGAGRNTFTFTYEYGLGSSIAYGSASVSFSVSGPTGLSVQTLPSQNYMAPVQVGNVKFSGVLAPGLSLGDGGVSGTQLAYGVILQATTTSLPANPGTFLWVQLLPSDHIQYSDATTRWSCVPPGWTGPALNTPTPPIDQIYPYVSGPANQPVNSAFDDSPSTPLSGTYGELAQTFSAKTYLLWDPTIPVAGQQTCNAAFVDKQGPHASTCSSIPVPLGYAAWSWSGDAINKATPQTNGTTFALASSQESVPAFVQSTSYPTWQSIAQTGASLPNFSCSKE